MTTRTVEQWLITAPQETFEALLSVTAERSRQEDLGWTPEHDDQHGVGHLVIEARRRSQQHLANGPRAGVATSLYRRWLVEQAAMFVAAIEVLDRGEAGSAVADPPAEESAPSIGDKIVALSSWIDASYPEEMIGSELHARRRVDKLMEELLDVAITSLGAYSALQRNGVDVLADLNSKLDRVLERVGLANG